MTRHLLLLITLGSFWGGLPVARAEGRVELELVTEARAPIMAQQEWLRRLAQARVGNLRIGGVGSPSKVGIVVGGTERSPVYKVTGLLTSSGDVLLPGGRFRPGDAARLAKWLDDLARSGPSQGRPGQQKTAFGLSARQFERLHEEMARPVAFSTKGMSRREVVEKIGKRLGVPLRFDPALLAAADDDVIAEELSSLSCGTALAYAVRPLGICLVPGSSGSRGLECALTKARPNLEAWPIGWEPEKRPGGVLPGLFEFLNTNVENVAVTKVLEAVGGRLEVPVLLDYNAMARHGIEPEKALVSLPRSRTSYSLLLKKTLYQAGLKSELRVDESGRPFLWITTIKPI